MSNLTEYAKNELELCGAFDSESLYGNMVGKAVMELVELDYGDTFAYRHPDGWGVFDITCGVICEYRRKTGDLWAYLPAPPMRKEGKEAIDGSSQ